MLDSTRAARCKHLPHQSTPVRMKKAESGIDPVFTPLPTPQEPERRTLNTPLNTRTHTLAVGLGWTRLCTSPAWPRLTIAEETIHSPAITTAGALEILTLTWQHAHIVHALIQPENSKLDVENRTETVPACDASIMSARWV